MYEFSDWLERPEIRMKQFNVDKEKVRQVFVNVRKSGRTNLLEEEGYEILSAYGFPRPKSFVAKSAEDCVKAAREVGYPVVMKIVSKDIIHKSDAGGVKVRLLNDEEVSQSFEEIMSNARKYKQDAEIKGVRGQKPSDTNALVDCLLRLSQLVTDFPEIEEFDMNPLLVLEEGKGACAVDVRIGLGNK